LELENQIGEKTLIKYKADALERIYEHFPLETMTISQYTGSVEGLAGLLPGSLQAGSTRLKPKLETH